MKYATLFLTLLSSLMATAQLPYTENEFGFSVQTDIEYGQDINFAGMNDTLLLDIYKPVGDDNCKRPCLILIHGGSWIGGSKNDINIVNMAESFAEKGWVVATINYRLGTHKTPGYEMYWLCNDDISAPCAYIADSSEVFRANYRGQQDAKGAIRFMKDRALMDSIDIQNVFVAGESAGAFISYAVAFMDAEDEKPEFCNAIADAPNPDADLVGCLPVGYSLARPDLGDVNGSLNLGTNDASVQGVGGFYGGMMNFDMIEGDTDWPVVYMYHQGSDVVVHYNYGRLLGRIDWECFSPTSLCQNYARYPKAYGSKGIETYFSGLAEAPTRTVDIIENYEYTGDCFDNGHSIDSWVLRSQNMADLFAERVAENGNEPSSGPCDLSVREDELQLKIFPNPSSGLINITTNANKPLKFKVYSSGGRLVLENTVTEKTDFHLASGVYIIEIISLDNTQIRHEKLIVL